MVVALVTYLFHTKATHGQVPDFSKYPVYTGKDLGLTYSAKRSIFKIWSPPAEKAELIFYKEGTVDNLYLFIQ